MSTGFVDYEPASSEKYGFDNFVRIIPRFSPQYQSIDVSNRFSTRILCHVLSLYLEKNNYFSPPVFLAVEGDAGEGKTTQSIAACTQKGITVLYMSGSSLSGSHESDSKNALERNYNKAATLKAQGQFVAMVIDDFHKSIASERESITKTINTNLLTGYMMNLAENTGNTQVPIILTANDVADIYAPLLRLGRADIFQWSPSHDERKHIVKTILNTFVEFSSDREFDIYFGKYQDKSIAFFSQLKNRYRLSMLEGLITDLPRIDESLLEQINAYMSSSMSKMSIHELFKLSQKQSQERK